SGRAPRLDARFRATPRSARSRRRAGLLDELDERVEGRVVVEEGPAGDVVVREVGLRELADPVLLRDARQRADVEDHDRLRVVVLGGEDRLGPLGRVAGRVARLVLTA